MELALRVLTLVLSFDVSLFSAPVFRKLSDTATYWRCPPGSLLATRFGSQFAPSQPFVSDSPQDPQLSSGFFEVDLCLEEPDSSS
jgi:hypothetical protein